MQKYAKIEAEKSKICSVGIGTNSAYYESIGYQLMDVEKAYNGDWYLAGYAPQAPETTYQELRRAAYPEVGEQLDMIYWDRVNGTNNWQEKISEIKAKYPKD